ncbi:MAG: aminopeptidase P family protein [Beijerinckiaceae bacterium]|jgi:Xaa-Pro aminopeptidase
MFESLFQSFDDHSTREHSRARLKALRAELELLGLDGFVVPRADRHQNEYVPPSEERLAWLTGFSGSAGLAVVLKTKAAIFVDGRYTLAVQDQVDTSVATPVALASQTPEAWIGANLRAGQKLGYDPWLATPSQVARLEKAAKAAGAELVALGTNPIDLVWMDRPAPPCGAITLRSARLAGETSAKKLARAAAATGKADALFISDPHGLAWAFNIRGADVSHTPLPLGFALVPKTGHATLFIDAKKLTPAAQAALAKTAVIANEASVETVLAALGKAGKTVLFDAATVPARLTQSLEAAGGTADLGREPVALMKARKNPAELRGTREAHLRDGIAITRFLHWFALNAKPGRLSEIAAAEALECFRRETGKLKDLSFPTISAAGPNSAIPHYRVTKVSNRKIGRGIFLIDSGGQYEDGTTDITRTLAVGRPDAEMRDRFTRVLKGHIAIARAVFPVGTSGAQIDALARAPLWNAGLDFDHGTGHGVGVYLSVHEGPQRISKAGHVALEPGMILSNEPGYYKAGHWGIRIENLIVVEPRDIEGGEREMLGFETITLAPIDLALVDLKLLDAGERAWLNAYHARVRKEIGPHLAPDERRWLTAVTKRI